ncbi:hypothetical protein BY458DRAFT_473712 [Sporodiniella umbellata]|nr:hypothetical protein BY458DRAFT_473712 [Sporodiniella umbellata]
MAALVSANAKMLTKEEIMALARSEYARQLSNYTKALLLKYKPLQSKNQKVN